jgi:hypothetical protein
LLKKFKKNSKKIQNKETNLNKFKNNKSLKKIKNTYSATKWPNIAYLKKINQNFRPSVFPPFLSPPRPHLATSSPFPCPCLTSLAPPLPLPQPHPHHPRPSLVPPSSLPYPKLEYTERLPGRKINSVFGIFSKIFVVVVLHASVKSQPA